MSLTNAKLIGQRLLGTAGTSKLTDLPNIGSREFVPSLLLTFGGCPMLIAVGGIFKRRSPTKIAKAIVMPNAVPVPRNQACRAVIGKRHEHESMGQAADAPARNAQENRTVSVPIRPHFELAPSSRRVPVFVAPNGSIVARKIVGMIGDRTILRHVPPPSEF